MTKKTALEQQKEKIQKQMQEKEQAKQEASDLPPLAKSVVESVRLAKGGESKEHSTDTDELLEIVLNAIKRVDLVALKHPKKMKQLRKKLAKATKSADVEEEEDTRDQIKKLRKSMKQKDYRLVCVKHTLEIAQDAGHNLCVYRGICYVYNGVFWCEVQEDYIKLWLGKFSYKMGLDEDESRDFMFKRFILQQFKEDALKLRPKHDINEYCLNLKNGTLHIPSSPNEEPYLQRHSPNDFLLSCSNFEYDTEATGTLWQAFLNRCLPEKDKQLVLAEYIASALINAMSEHKIKHEKILFLIGDGSNGKSVVFEVLKGLFGDAISNFTMEDLTSPQAPYYIAELEGKILNIDTDLSRKSLDSSTLKKIASGEPMTARKPFGRPTSVRVGKFINSTNEMPFINENSYGLVRRMLFIVFGETIGKDEKDVHLATKIIQKESAVVLNWILEGLKRLKKNKGFSPCKSSDEFLEEFRRHIDSVVAFIEEKNYVPSTDESQGIVGRQALYDEYKMFCSSNGYKNHVHISKFKKRLEGMGFKGDKDRNVRYFLMHKVDYNENFRI